MKRSTVYCDCCGDAFSVLLDNVGRLYIEETHPQVRLTGIHVELCKSCEVEIADAVRPVLERRKDERVAKLKAAGVFGT